MAFVILAVLASYLGSDRTQVYEAQTAVLVGNGATTLNVTDQAAGAFLAVTLAPLVDTPTVVGAAISHAGVARGVDAVVSNTTATVPSGQQLIHIAVRDKDPLVARSLVNSITTTFVSDVATLAPVVSRTKTGTTDTPPAKVAYLASVPGAPVGTSLGRNLGLGALVGLLLAAAVVFLIDGFGLSARPPRKFEEQLGLPVLGAVPDWRDVENQEPVTAGKLPAWLVEPTTGSDHRG